MIPPPRTHDGRNLDLRIAEPRGEAMAIDIDDPDSASPLAPEAIAVAPCASVADTYYDLPVVKAPPWKWYIAAYFYGSGLAGAAATLAAAADLAGERRLARQLHAITSIGEAAGALCLIGDLGRPARFHYMLRVWRPTSPMNLGAWLLAAASASGGWALLDSVRGRRGLGVAGAASAVTGAMLSTYTGVLIGNTAIPIWSATRRRMPLWFAAVSAASLASLLELIGPPRREPRALLGYRIVAKAASLVGAQAVEAAAHGTGVAGPLRTGRSGRMWRGAGWLGAASLVATLFGRPRLAGALGTAAALIARFAIVEAGRASAADPRDTFEPQRRTIGAGAGSTT
jgi:hypothetical protein